MMSPQVTEVDSFCAALDASVASMSHPRWCGQTPSLAVSANSYVYPRERSPHARGPDASVRTHRRGRPLAHLADEGGISRATLTKWYKRWLIHGEAGLYDRTSRPDRQPTRISDDSEDMVTQLRTLEKWGPDRIAGHLTTVGDGSISLSPATVWRILSRHGIGRLRDLDMPTGESKRDPRRYEHPNPGDMIHVDVKKVGRIPDGGGWAIHGARHRRSTSLPPRRQPPSRLCLHSRCG
jgi:hypothetical protein